MADLNLALVISTLDRASRPLQRIGRSVSDVGRKARKVGRDMRSVGTGLSALLTGPLGAGGGFAIKAFSDIEQMQVRYGVMLGDQEKGLALVKELIDFAAKTPFQLPGLDSATKQLLSAGVSTTDLNEELKLIGDIAAGTGKPIDELAQIYTKAMNKGKVQTEELNQLSEAGIPILDALVALAGDYGNEISKEDVYKAAEKGQIEFRVLREALEKLSGEGGIYNEMMQKQSETTAGLASTMKDNLFLALASVGEKIVEITGLKDRMKEFTERIQQATEWLDRMAEERPGLVRLVFGLTAAALVLGPALLALGVVVGGVGIGLTALGAVIGVLFSPVLLLGAAFAAAAWLLYDNWDGVVAFFEDVWAGIKEAFPGTAAFFEDLWAKAALPVPGIFDWVTGAWDRTITAIRTGDYSDLWDGIKGAGTAATAAAATFYLDAWAAFQALDWTALGADLGELVVAGIVTLTNLAGSLTSSVEGMDFKSVGETIGKVIGQFMAGRITSLAGVVSGMLERVSELDFVGIGDVIGGALLAGLKAAVIGLAGVLAGMTATAKEIDWGEVGEMIGKSVKAALLIAIDLGTGLAKALVTAATDGTLLKAAGDLGEAILDALVAALAGITDAIAGMIKGAMPDWLLEWVEGDGEPAPVVRGARMRPEGALPTMPVAEVPVYALPGAAAEGSLYADDAAGGGARRGRRGFAPVDRAEVNGEIAVRFENTPPGTTVERVSGEGVDLTADLGYAMNGN